MLDAARRGDAGALPGDSAFRQVMRLSALVSMVSLWFVTRLPDLRLHDAPTAAAGTAAEL